MTDRNRHPAEGRQSSVTRETATGSRPSPGAGADGTARYAAVRDPFDIWVVWDTKTDLPVMQAGTVLSAEPGEIETLVASLCRRDGRATR